MGKLHIKVFVTSTMKFRARIKEEGKPQYEVTIVGWAWQRGKGKEHHSIISDKCKAIVEHLNSQRLKLTFHQL